MSDHSGSDDDALLRAAAAQLAAKQQQKGKSAGRHQQVKSAGDTDEQNHQQKKQGKRQHQQQQSAAGSDDEDAPQDSKSRGKTAKQPQLTQYEAWKSKQGAKGGRTRDSASDDDDGNSDARKGSRAQQREAAHAAQQPKQREAKPTRVPIKVERAKATRQADIDSGIAGALRDLALKKKQKQKQKKLAKKLAAGGGEESEEEESAEDADSDEQSESGNESDDDEKPAQQSTATAASAPAPEAADDGLEEEDLDTDDDPAGAYREQHAIQILSIDDNDEMSQKLESNANYFPVASFSSLVDEFSGGDQSLPREHLQTLIDATTSGFVKPTPIQAQTWPILLSGLDVVGIASTGSGKTCAFLLPAIYYIMQKRRQLATVSAPSAASASALSPHVLVLAPTRELAIQIHKVASEICTKLSPTASSSSSPTSSSTSIAPIHTYVVFGGTSIDAQLSSLRSLPGLDILVATPGRLQKHLKESSLSLSKIGFFVLDEADRMLDLGFEEALQSIASSITSGHQTALFSATWEKSAQAAAAHFLKRGPKRTVKVVIGTENLTAAKSVTQVVEVVDRRQGKREKRLLELLEQYHASRTNRILVFVLYKQEASLLADHLNRRGWNAAAITGDHKQTKRVQALERFRSGEVPILVATDVAARGLDVHGITHVINFSVGLSVEQYIHRVGRCGRAGATGLAHTFVVDFDAPHTPGLVKLLEESGHPVSPELREMAERAARQAAKHAGAPDQQLKGDAYFASLKKGALTKNVNLQKQLAKEAEEDDIEAKIFGTDAKDEGVLQKGKKQHAIHSKHRPGGHQGKKGGGKGRPH